MTKFLTKSAPSLGALVAILAFLHGIPAHAQGNTVSWVSNTGDDSSICGAPSVACRTLQVAVNKTTPGGIVAVADPGDYDGLTITKSINISDDGAGDAHIRPFETGPNIAINAGVGDVISLRGLMIDGEGRGTTGIQINSSSAVHIQNCVIRNFQGHTVFGGSGFGIAFVPTHNSQLFVSDTIIFNNGTATLTGGILVEPQAAISSDVVLDRVHLENNVDGLLIDGLVASGPGSHVVVRDSVMSGNAGNGIHAVTVPGQSPAFVFVEHSSMVRNGAAGVLADGPGATVLLNDNSITRNGTGISATNGGQLFSYGNNKNNNNVGAEGAPTGFFSQM